jgi:hypothetical protein
MQVKGSAGEVERRWTTHQQEPGRSGPGVRATTARDQLVINLVPRAARYIQSGKIAIYIYRC